MTYPFGEVKIKETDLMPEAFIYKFTHKPTSRWYLGMHGLKEDESHRDGAYWNSSTDEEFKELLQTKPQEFLYEISEYGTVSAIYKKENELLESSNAAKDPMSWNKWNGIKYQSKELPRLDLIDELATDAYDKESDLERKLERVNEIFDDVDLVKLQVRFDTALSSKKIGEYKNEMKSNNSTKGFTLTIVRLPGGKKVLVGGNHTGQSARSAKMIFIDVVYIDEDLSMEEMLALGDALNRKKEIQRMTTHMDDVAGKLVEFYDNKKITDDTFKDKYSTDYIKITGGFKGSEIAKVRKIAKDIIEDRGNWKAGKVWKDWSVRTKIIRKEKEKLVKAEMDDNIFCTTQSSMFRTDRIMEQWIEDRDARVEVNKKPRPNIKVLMHYSTASTHKEYVKSQVVDIHERILKSFLKGEGIKNPIIIFKDLEYYEDKVS